MKAATRQNHLPHVAGLALSARGFSLLSFMRGSGFSIPEILVAAGVGVLCLFTVFLMQRSMARQTSSGDYQTRAWHTYARLSSILRHDLLQATRIETPDPATLQIELTEIDDQFRERKTPIIWTRRNDRSIIRTAPSQIQVFDFSDALGRQERLTVTFSVEK